MDESDRADSQLGELRVSARGWHGVQLAVLGFIGLCGVLQQDAGKANPNWLQVAAGVLVVTALGTACVATVLIALAAWPVYGAGPAADGAADDIARTRRRLRVGITLTFVAVAMLALGASSTWWPNLQAGSSSLAVEVSTRAGVICGELKEPPGQGILEVSAAGQLIEIRLVDLVSLRPVDRCE